MTTADRIKHAAAIVLLGDGVAGILLPAHDAEFWKQGPSGWRQGMRWCQRHPEATRLIAVAQAALAAMWLMQQERGVRKLFG